MPNLTIPFVSIEASIQNDIYYEILKDVAEIINVDENTAQILYNSMEVGKTDARSNAIFNKENNTPTTTALKRLTVNIRDEFDDDTVGSGIVNRRDSFPVFRDPEIGVSIAPVYINSNISFEFKYTSPSKVDVDRMRDLIRMHLSRSKSMFTHDVEYTMIVPEFVENFLIHIHELKNRLFPIPLENYMAGYATNRLHAITDMSNKGNTMLAVREKQLDVIGEFEFVASPPDKDVDNSKKQYSLSFNYKVQMEIPKAINVSFPIVVCNSLIDDKYINIVEKQAKKDLSRKITKHLHLGRSATIMNNLQTTTTMEQMASCIYPIHLPIFDLYTDYTKVPGYGTIMTILVGVDEDDKKTLFNLNDLDDWYFPKHTIDYIKRNLTGVTKLYESFIYFGLDQKGKYMARDILTIDEDLNVRSTVELNLIRPIRIVVMACIDLTFLTENALNDLIKDDSQFESFLLEYLELKNTFTLERTSQVNARDNKLYRIIINKFRELYDRRMFDIIKRYVKILVTDPSTSNYLAELLVMGYPELYSDLTSKYLCWVDRTNMLRTFSEDEGERAKQVEEMNSHTKERRNPYLINNEYLNEEQYRTRLGLRQYLQKTVNAKYLLAQRLEGEE